MIEVIPQSSSVLKQLATGNKNRCFTTQSARIIHSVLIRLIIMSSLSDVKVDVYLKVLLRYLEKTWLICKIYTLCNQCQLADLRIATQDFIQSCYASP